MVSLALGSEYVYVLQSHINHKVTVFYLALDQHCDPTPWLVTPFSDIDECPLAPSACPGPQLT